MTEITNVDDRDTNIDSSINTTVIAEDHADVDLTIDNQTASAAGDGAVAAGDDAEGVATGDRAVAAGDDVDAAATGDGSLAVDGDIDRLGREPGREHRCHRR